MQFAGQRTDENLKLIGDPDDILIKLSDDVLPEPDAILVHGITPQRTLEEGITEAEFSKIFSEKIATANTVFVGFNNIRFDDEFTRRIMYRTFYDPYRWHWKDGRSRWDILDPIRMMRALRPEGLKWPTINGKPSVKLELMAKENKLTHDNAHDALSDVIALIELTQKFKESQPKLFDYLVSMRDKKKVAKLVLNDQPFVYTSGKFSNEFEKTTIVDSLFKHPRRDSAVVYDLRHDPTEWFKKSVSELVKHWTVRYGDDLKPLPVKTIQFNRCPAVAPLGVLDDKSKKRIKIDMKVAEKHRAMLAKHPEFIKKLQDALDVLENEQQTRLPLEDNVDNQLYDGFWGDQDQDDLARARLTLPEELGNLEVANKRIREMIPLYKARNFSSSLSVDEKEAWEVHRRKVLLGGDKSSSVAKFYKRLEEIAKTRKLSTNDEYLLTELQLYAESIIPEPLDRES